MKYLQLQKKLIKTIRLPETLIIGTGSYCTFCQVENSKHKKGSLRCSSAAIFGVVCWCVGVKVWCE